MWKLRNKLNSVRCDPVSRGRMTKSPSLVLAALMGLCLSTASSSQAAAKSSTSKSKSTAKSATTTKKKTSSSSSASSSSSSSGGSTKTASTTKSKSSGGGAAKSSSSTPSAAPKAVAVDESLQEEVRKAVPTDKVATSSTTGSSKATAGTTEKKIVAEADKPKDKDAEGGPSAKKKPAAVSTMLPEELAGFEAYPPKLQEVVRKALELTTQNLRYQFGSSDPKAGGMDCSGTMCHVLQSSGIKGIPRQSDEICRWVMRNAVLYRTEGSTSLKNAAFSALHPGDLLFWTGTYDTGGKRELPITHVMMYLGKRKKDGKPIVFGSSDGRSYNGERRNGVSVFDFSLPQRGSKATFYGYGPIPGMPKEEIMKPVPKALPAFAAQ